MSPACGRTVRQNFGVFHQQGSIGMKGQPVDFGVARIWTHEVDQFSIRRKCRLVLHALAVNEQPRLAAALKIECIEVWVTATVRSKNEPAPVR